MNEALREQIRQHANYACEFCGVSETDTGGLLTIDHFQPFSKGGSDDPENLVYCCPRCNQYKLDYWPNQSNDPQLWHPRHEPFSRHFIELEDGVMHPLTPVGAFTLARLRLNRPPLVAHRRQKRQRAEEKRLMERYRQLAQLLEQLLMQETELLNEQRMLLKEQLRVLQTVARRGD